MSSPPPRSPPPPRPTVSVPGKQGHRLLYTTTTKGTTILHELARPPPSWSSSSWSFAIRWLLAVGWTAGVWLIWTKRHDAEKILQDLTSFAPWTYFVSTFLLAVLLLGRWILFTAINQRHVQAESVLVIKDFGIQLQTRYTNGKEKLEFVDLERVRAVIINEGITLHRVIYYLALVVEDRPSLLVAFQHLQPRLDELLPVYHSLQAVLKASRGKIRENKNAT